MIPPIPETGAAIALWWLRYTRSGAAIAVIALIIAVRLASGYLRGRKQTIPVVVALAIMGYVAPALAAGADVSWLNLAQQALASAAAAVTAYEVATARRKTP